MSRQASGLRAWVVQRVSAIYLALFFIYLLGHFAVNPPADFAAWKAWVGYSGVAVSAALFFAALLLHAWVGFRDVLIDYVHPAPIRIGLLALLAVVLSGCGLWAIQLLAMARVG